MTTNNLIYVLVAFDKKIEVCLFDDLDNAKIHNRKLFNNKGLIVIRVLRKKF